TLSGSWATTITPLGSNLNFATAVTVTSTGQFTWVETNPLTGQVTTVQGTYTLGPPTSGGVTELTLVLQGQIFLQGVFAQPGAGASITEPFSRGPVTSTGFIPFCRQWQLSHRRGACSA